MNNISRIFVTLLFSSSLFGHAQLLRAAPPGTLERQPYFANFMLYGSAPDLGFIGQATVGHDALIGAFGARLSLEIGFNDAPSSLAADVIGRFSYERFDGYGGVGGGLSFESAGTFGFGEAVGGLGYRLSETVGLFAEGRIRPYLDGTGDILGGAGLGVQLRFDPGFGAQTEATP